MRPLELTPSRAEKVPHIRPQKRYHSHLEARRRSPREESDESGVEAAVGGDGGAFWPGRASYWQVIGLAGER